MIIGRYNTELVVAHWSPVLISVTVAGVCGIVSTFRGQRKRALLLGGVSGIPAVLFFAYASWDVLTAANGWPLSEYLGLIWVGLFPLAAGFWAILLGLLVPEKPDRPLNSEWPRQG